MLDSFTDEGVLVSAVCVDAQPVTRMAIRTEIIRAGFISISSLSVLDLPTWPNPTGSRGIESPAPLRERSDLAFATVRCAAAFAFAIVLGLTAVGAGFAATLAFATVQSLAIMFAGGRIRSDRAWLGS